MHEPPLTKKNLNFIQNVGININYINTPTFIYILKKLFAVAKSFLLFFFYVGML